MKSISMRGGKLEDSEDDYAYEEFVKVSFMMGRQQLNFPFKFHTHSMKILLHELNDGFINSGITFHQHDDGIGADIKINLHKVGHLLIDGTEKEEYERFPTFSTNAFRAVKQIWIGLIKNNRN